MPVIPRELVVLAEVVLERDRGEGLILPLDRHPLLRLDGLVQPVAPAAAGHQPARELVHDDDLAVLHHVVDVALEEGVRAQRLVDVVQERHVGGVVQAAGLEPVAEKLLRLRHAGLGQRDRLVLFVLEKVARVLELLAPLRRHVALRDRTRLEPRDDPIDLDVEVGGLLRRTRNDERRARLVDQDAVDLVDDGEAVLPLHELCPLELHVVAEVVEPELVVRAVGDVAAVRRVALGVPQVVLDHADAQAQKTVDAPHPVGVAAGEIVVDGDDVDAPSLQGVQVGGQRRDQRLALAGLHLGDLAAVQHDAADELDVEVAHLENAPAGFPNRRERLHEQIVERLALLDPLAKGGGPVPELRVGETAHGVLAVVDRGDERPHALEVAGVLGAEGLGQEGLEHQRTRGGLRSGDYYRNRSHARWRTQARRFPRRGGAVVRAPIPRRSTAQTPSWRRDRTAGRRADAGG